jgi:16S rRNA (guanine527-N7)-methyltransferase
MDDAHIAELLAPFLSDRALGVRHRSSSQVTDSVELSAEQLRYISMYIDILLRWNSRVNLTAVRDANEIVTRHFGESIFAARHLFPDPTTTAYSQHVIDVGSGAGFPGLPIKIWAPHSRLTLIESNQKKATFLREVVRGLSLAGVEVFPGRADGFTGGPGEVVTLRAVERFELVLPIAAALVAPSGRLAILVGPDQAEEARKLAPRLRWSEPNPLPLSKSRCLIIGSNEP